MVTQADYHELNSICSTSMVIKPSDNPTCLLRNQLQTRETETGPGITGHETVGCDKQQERGRLIPFQQDGANWIT